MEMTTCPLCGKIFGSSGKGTCGQCNKLLDIVYDKARSYLRDNPKEKPDAKELAKAIDEDAKYIEMLMLDGRFDSDSDGAPESLEEKKRQQLLESFQKNISSDKPERRKASTYGSDRHGRD